MLIGCIGYPSMVSFATADTDSEAANDNNSADLSKKELWQEAATSEPISRDELNINNSNSDNGLQLLNEGVQYYNFSRHKQDNNNHNANE